MASWPSASYARLRALSLDPQHPHSLSAGDVQTTKGALLASKSSGFMSSRLTKRPYLKNLRWRETKEDIQCRSVASTSVCTYVHACQHRCTHTGVFIHSHKTLFRDSHTTIDGKGLKKSREWTTSGSSLRWPLEQEAGIRHKGWGRGSYIPFL